jgi:hypothetical protein
MAKKNFVFFLIITSVAFQDGFISHRSIPSTASFITSDNLGNIYTITNDVLEKYDRKGNLVKTYSNKSLGKISSVDASNPLKLVLFYKDFSQVLFLDNMLSLSGDPVRLADLNLEQAQLVSSSHNNGIWLYNQQNFELLRLDQNLQKVQQTGNITQLISQKINPNFLLENNNMVYLNDPSVGILVFDIYGTYYKTIPLKSLTSIQLNDEEIFYFSDKKLKSFHLKTLEEKNYPLPDSTAIAARIEKEGLFLLKKNSLEIYLK